jgi:hypothetical protein
MRREDVARVAGVMLIDVEPLTSAQVRQALADRVSAIVLDVATQEPATYWRTPDERIWLDDPYFGDVVSFERLEYNEAIGLHIRREA